MDTSVELVLQLYLYNELIKKLMVINMLSRAIDDDDESPEVTLDGNLKVPEEDLVRVMCALVSEAANPDLTMTKKEVDQLLCARSALYGQVLDSRVRMRVLKRAKQFMKNPSNHDLFKFIQSTGYVRRMNHFHNRITNCLQMAVHASD